MFLQDELLAELAELEQEEHEEIMKNMGRLPSAPTTKLPSTRPSRNASKCAMTPTHTFSIYTFKIWQKTSQAHTVCASLKCLLFHSFSLQEESGG